MTGDPTTAAEKATLRTRAKAWLDGQSAEALARRSSRVCAALTGSSRLRDARCIMLYAPLKREADVSAVALWALARGVVVCVPQMNWAERTMEPAAIASWTDDLALTRLGLREPRPGVPRVPIDRLDAVLVPGLAFDRAGRRLGRGAGFYDRFLPRLSPRTAVVGTALAGQVVETVPTEATDCRVGWLATELGLLRAGPALGAWEAGGAGGAVDPGA